MTTLTYDQQRVQRLEAQLAERDRTIRELRELLHTSCPACGAARP